MSMPAWKPKFRRSECPEKKEQPAGSNDNGGGGRPRDESFRDNRRWQGGYNPIGLTSTPSKADKADNWRAKPRVETLNNSRPTNLPRHGSVQSVNSAWGAESDNWRGTKVNSVNEATEDAVEKQVRENRHRLEEEAGVTMLKFLRYQGKKSEKGSNEKLTKVVPEQLGPDRDNKRPASKAPVGTVVGEVGPSYQKRPGSITGRTVSSDIRSASDDGTDGGLLGNKCLGSVASSSSKNWTNTETVTDKKIRDNLHRLINIGYEELARELSVELSVLRDGVAKYFMLEEENRLDDVNKVFDEQSGQEKKKKEKHDKDYTKKEKILRELAIHRILTYMDLTKYDSFDTIATRHGISKEDQKKNVISFFEFKKYLLELGDGEEIEDRESNVKVEGQTDEVDQVMDGDGESWTISGAQNHLENTSNKFNILRNYEFELYEDHFPC